MNLKFTKLRINTGLFLAFITAISGMVLTSCNNTLDINGEYETIHVVYGILNPSEKRQYIKINRAFLTDGNVYDAALEPDSTNFNYKLDVVVEELDQNRNLFRTFHLDTVMVNRTGDVFKGGKQPVYYFDIPDYSSVINYNSTSRDTLWLDPEHSFILKINNTKAGIFSESSTPLIPNFSINKPAPYNKFVSFTSSNRVNIEMKSAKYGKIYEVKFVLYYREVYDDAPQDTTYNEIVWKLGSNKSTRLSGNEDIYISYVPASFFSILQNKIPVVQGMKRYFGKLSPLGRVDVQLIITVGTDELNTYIDVNAPSGSLIQDKPVYTNISNGIGIFTAKRIIRLNYTLNQITVDSLRNGSKTWQLNFK